MRFALSRPTGVSYFPKFDEYSITVLFTRSSLLISFCPWCGTRLPRSRRYDWFDRLEVLGLEPESADLPEPLKSDRWWKEDLGRKTDSD
jgi:hypothetical protein